jgi:hypothetical protein
MDNAATTTMGTNLLHNIRSISKIDVLLSRTEEVFPGTEEWSATGLGFRRRSLENRKKEKRFRNLLIVFKNKLPRKTSLHILEAENHKIYI